MNSMGLSTAQRSRPRSVVTMPLVVSPPSLPVFHAGRPCLATSSSTTWKPLLWRLRAYFAPGLPRPTTSHIATCPRDYFFAAGLAAAAGAALPGAALASLEGAAALASLPAGAAAAAAGAAAAAVPSAGAASVVVGVLSSS